MTAIRMQISCVEFKPYCSDSRFDFRKAYVLGHHCRKIIASRTSRMLLYGMKLKGEKVRNLKNCLPRK